MSSWQQAIVIDSEIGDGKPTLPYAFNLGLLVGLPGRWSLIPYLVLLVLVGERLRRVFGVAQLQDVPRPSVAGWSDG